MYHCCKFIESIRESHDIRTDTHFIKSNDQIVGVVFATGGNIVLDHFFKTKTSSQFQIDKSIMLNYFHIAPEFRGLGENWLKEIILPYYKRIGIEEIFTKSTHVKSFSLYARMGQEIGSYTVQSDNRLYRRKGKVFQIKI